MSTVVAQPYSTAGNGGRKLVRLSNGWLVAVVTEGQSTNTRIRFYKSTDNGSNWTEVCYAWGGNDVAIVSTGTVVHAVYKDYTTSPTYLYYLKFDAVTQPSGHKAKDYSLETPSTATALGNVSLAIDPTNGHLHASWTSKNGGYPNSFNIRYAKSTDGGATWSIATQITTDNNVSMNMANPSIVVRNGKPLIFYNLQSSTSNVIFVCFYNGTQWDYRSVYAGGSYVQSNPSAVVDKDGVIHVAWSGTDSNSSVPKIRYSKSTDGGISWATQTPILNGYNPSITTDKNGQLFILFDTSASIGKLWLQSNNVWLNTYIKSNSDTNVSPSALYDVKFDSVFGDIPPLIHQVTGKSVQYLGSLTTNSAPTIALTSPSNNQTLYENDTLNISGNAYDSDKDQSVTAYYQINSEPKKVLATNLSQTQIALSKQLTFKGGKLYDGDTALTGTLADGVAHTLKVWAEDSEKASSAIIERTFYVVPNRAPLLTVNNPTQSGIVDADSFSISGTYNDADGNTTTVAYRINGGNSVQIAQGISGDFTFDITLGSLQIGANAITIEATDSYGAKTTKTVKLNKSKIATPITRSTVRYKVAPPSGTASEILVWVQRDANLTLDASVSMTLSGEAESFTTMTKNSTTTLPNGKVEDEFYHQVAEAKDSIILKFDLVKSSAETDAVITLITGVF